MVIVRCPSPFCYLHTNGFLEKGRGKGVSHSHSLLFSIFAGRSLVPIPRQEIIINFVNGVDSGDVENPHTEGTVAVNRILLEISIHFISVCVKEEVLKNPKPWEESTLG